MPYEFDNFVVHPRFGQGPRFTGLDPQDDYASQVFLHWHSPEGVRVPNTAIAADLTRQAEATIPVTHYFDTKRECVDCLKPFLFFAAEQQYWYEDLGFPLEADCIRCVDCRRRLHGLERKRHRYEELYHEANRTSEQSYEMVDCALSLSETGLFGKRQLELVRRILKTLPSNSDQQKLWDRVHALERGG